MRRVELVLPTLNAASHWERWREGLRRQTLQPAKVWVVDSSSDDGTAELARSAGFEVRVIARRDFDHGGTRQSAVESCSSELVVFLTQDAVLAEPRSLETLAACFENPRVAAAYGRQLPRPGAGPVEAHARLFNYPARSRLKSLSDGPELGIKTVFISNSFAAYRRETLLEAGGFPSGVIMCEDTYAAARLVLGGWKIAYCAEAAVFHSHPYTLMQEFRRYFDLGVFYSGQPWIGQSLGRAESEGLRFVKSELSYLLRRGPHLIPSALLRGGLKLAGFRLGARHRSLPPALRSSMSMHKSFWTKEAWA